MTTTWFDPVTKRDARLLYRWWTRHSTRYQFHIERSSVNRRYYALIAVTLPNAVKGTSDDLERVG